MASPAQVAANRQNSLRSTGPASVAGKAVSRFNALKSGIDAKSVVIPREDPAELETLKANYHLQFLPGSPVEQFLVDTLIHADWKLRRLRKREAQLLTPADSIDEKQLDRLDRQINTTQRAWFRALKELQNQIATRTAEEVEQALSLTNPAAALDSARAPEIGFVPADTESIPQTAALAQPQTVSSAPSAHRAEPKINLALRL